MTHTLPPLSTLDPTLAWAPWSPDAQNPFDLKWAAHLFRRAAFGVPAYRVGEDAWQGLQRCVKQGHEATLKEVLDGLPGQGDFDVMLDTLGPKIGKSPRFEFMPDTGLSEIQAWWVYRMVYSPHPLLEKLTLFWHNHFATSVAKVKKSTLMLKQNQLLRQHALAKFRPLLLEMSKDPAMLIWLDSNSNVKSAPNENYAREVMELFSLGVGNYTETDIREAARAFTGWHAAGTEFLFSSAQHDFGPKTILTQKGNWDGGDVLRILLEQPVAARFLVKKLYRYLISENESPPDALIEPLAEEYRKSGYDSGLVVRKMLRSRLFFSQHAYRQRIKSPAEYVVGLVRTLGGQVGPANLAKSITDLGQKLFAPPNVKGWDDGKAWLNSGTLLARHNLAWDMVGTANDGPHPDIRGGIQVPGFTPFDSGPPVHQAGTMAIVEKHGGKQPEEKVNWLLALFLQGDAQPGTKQKLIDYLKSSTAKASEKAKDAEKKEEVAQPVDEATKRLRETMHTILLLPEYQLA
jgi:hypothetical protein